jgi:cytochrome-b5 reductase
MVQRAYTPVSVASQRGYVDLIIKVCVCVVFLFCEGCPHTMDLQIYPTGAMSQHIETLNIGDEIAVRGPHGLMQYTPNMKKHVGMIAGGSGVTPMIQVWSDVVVLFQCHFGFLTHYCSWLVR